MSVTENNGFGRGKGADRDFNRNVRVEIMVSDAIVWEVRQQAWTGEQGEGKIYVLEVVRLFEYGPTNVVNWRLVLLYGQEHDPSKMDPLR